MSLIKTFYGVREKLFRSVSFRLASPLVAVEKNVSNPLICESN